MPYFISFYNPGVGFGANCHPRETKRTGSLRFFFPQYCRGPTLLLEPASGTCRFAFIVAGVPRVFQLRPSNEALLKARVPGVRSNEGDPLLRSLCLSPHVGDAAWGAIVRQLSHPPTHWHAETYHYPGRGASSTACCASTEDHQAPSRPLFCEQEGHLATVTTPRVV